MRRYSGSEIGTVSADWFTDDDGDLARLRCVLQLEDAMLYFQ